MSALVKFLVALVLILLGSFTNLSFQEQVQLAPALYVFGDDALVPPPPAAGFNWGQFVAMFLGLPPVPAYNSSSVAAEEQHGLNFALEGAGILPQTSSSNRLNSQVEKFSSALTENEKLTDKLGKAIFLVSLGSIDFIKNYLPGHDIDDDSTLPSLDPEAYANLLTNEMAARLKKLHDLGARRFLVNNVFPLGCAPKYNLQKESLKKLCNGTVNQLLIPYSTKLPTVLSKLESELPDSTISVSNLFKFWDDIVQNGDNYGITQLGIPCQTSSLPCGNSFFFNDVQMTEAASKILAQQCFNGTDICTPNILGLLG